MAFYAAVGVGAAALTLAAFAVAVARGAPGAATGLLAAAAGLSLLHSAATGRAAPTMFPDRPARARERACCWAACRPCARCR